ncbi:MAG: DUF4364 family protein [Clostridiales bacterium]|jgi:hypothetical protein|nr:DUF4364 family protein [Clostridiales bacterium]
MDRLGFIHEKLDIKILILYVLRRLPKPVSFETLSDLVMIDDGFDYFEYSQCLAELVDTGHVEQNENSYKITEIGAVHGDTVESSIPYSVRLKAERNARPLIEKMRRDALIGTSHELLKNGGCNVKLSLSDGIGDIISLSILSSDEEQAKKIEKYFREDAENIYHKIVNLLTAEE